MKEIAPYWTSTKLTFYEFECYIIFIFLLNKLLYKNREHNNYKLDLSMNLFLLYTCPFMAAKLCALFLPVLSFPAFPETQRCVTYCT